jgi:hypothetical protein
MTTKLARLINWVGEILDRNLIMVPELDERQATELTGSTTTHTRDHRS